MTRVEFLGEFARIVEVDVSALDADTTLSSLGGWDSMATMAFLAMVDARLGVVIEPARLAQCRTVGDLLGLVHGRLSD